MNVLQWYLTCTTFYRELSRVKNEKLMSLAGFVWTFKTSAGHSLGRVECKCLVFYLYGFLVH